MEARLLFAAQILQAGPNATANLTHAGSAMHYYGNQWWGSATQNTNGYKTPAATGFVATITLNNAGGPIDFHSDDPGQPPPGAADGDDGQLYSVVLTGKLRSGAAGQYLFITQSDDDSYFVVNGKLVAAYPGGHADDTAGMTAFPITLAAGTEYNYQYYMSEGGGGHGFHARWVQPGEQDPSNGGANKLGYADASLIPLAFAAGDPGITVDVEDVPPAPTLPAGGAAAIYTDVSSSSVKINFVDNAASEMRYVLDRSLEPDFSSLEDAQIDLPPVFSDAAAGGPGGAAASTIIGLSPGTTYYFRLRASNYDGESALLNLGSVTTLSISTPSNPVARVQNNGDVSLSWVDLPPTGAKVSIQRSVNGGAFAEIAQVNTVLPGARNGYTDQTATFFNFAYRYRLQSIGGAGNNTLSPTVDVPFTVIPASSIRPIDYPQGFSTAVPINGGVWAGPNMDLQFVGNSNSAAVGLPTLFDSGNDGLAAIRLTDNSPAGGQASAVWTTDKVDLTGRWMIQFDFQLNAGAIADGFTFALQNNSNSFVGSSGGGGGYNGIGANALGIGFDTYNNHSVTGAFIGDTGPTSNDETNNPYAPGLGTNHGLDLNPLDSGINLKSGHSLRVLLSYDGTNLSEMVSDLQDPSRLVFNYNYGAVNLQQVLGGDSAWMGFTGATGGATEQVDIYNWVYSRSNLVIDPVVTLTVDDGTAQRSVIRSVSVNFGAPVTLSNGALRLFRDVTSADGNLTGAISDISTILNPPTTSDGGITWKWTFAASTGSDTDASGGLTDGVYHATLDHTKVSFTAGGTLLADFTFSRFHRLFGDVNNSKSVNNADLVLFRTTFGKPAGDPAYLRSFDLDGNGTINNADFGEFRKRFLKTFNYT